MPDPGIENGGFKTISDGLRDIRKEVGDTRNLMIKTDNLVMGLQVEMKNIQKRQETYERKYRFHGWFANILIVVVVFSGTYFAFEQRSKHLLKEKADVEKKLKENREELDALTGKIEKKSRVEREALEIYKALDEGKKEEALRGLSRLSIDELSVLEQKTLKDKIAGLKTELAQYAIEKATELLRKDNARAALQEIDRGREYADKPEIDNHMVLLAAQAHQKLSKPEKAVEVLEELVARQQKGPRVDQALWNLAVLHESMRELGKARASYGALAENHRETQYGRMAVRRLRQMEKEAAGKRKNAHGQ
ncbi:MAG: hypothetical protein HY897_11900 [Deltaproteobacteria bacterium]|nr:hypothetical protein [Deltaproteobacteria bacterium]